MPTSTLIHVSIPVEYKQTLQTAASLNHLSLSAWARITLIKAANDVVESNKNSTNNLKPAQSDNLDSRIKALLTQPER